MDDVEDDNWMREFHVSDPQKTHAGYTVYRISSKVMQNIDCSCMKVYIPVIY